MTTMTMMIGFAQRLPTLREWSRRRPWWCRNGTSYFSPGGNDLASSSSLAFARRSTSSALALLSCCTPDADAILAVVG